MITALVGVVGAVVGVVVGKAVDQRVEERRWLREAQARAHVDYVHAFQRLRHLLRLLATTMEHGSPAWTEVRARRREQMASYGAALAHLQLVGDPAVVGAALTVDARLRELNDLITTEPLGEARWHEERLAMDESMRQCVDVIRRSLRLTALGPRRPTAGRLRRP
jgi:hypothetical protein